MRSRVSQHPGDVLSRIESILGRDPQPADDPSALAEFRLMLEHMTADGNLRRDPVREVLARTGDKWSPLLLLLLQIRSFRHATLWRLVATVAGDGPISHRVLRIRLRTLEHDGLVDRTVVSTKPMAVCYSLTAAGRELAEHIQALMSWARTHSTDIEKARKRFNASEDDNRGKKRR